MDKRMRILSRVRNACCAIGYLPEDPEEYRQNPGSFQVVGTGFLVRDVTVMTNRHVIQDLDDLQKRIGFSDEHKYVKFIYPIQKGRFQEGACRLQVTSVSQRPEVDVGFIEIRRRPEPAFRQCMPLEFGSLFQIQTGQTVAAFGYPHGTDLLTVKDRDTGRIEIRRFGPLLQHGFVSAIAPFENARHPEKILLDMRIAGGMSGSPVFRIEDGKVIGLIYAELGKTTAFAIPIDSHMLRQWLRFHEAARPGSVSISKVPGTEGQVVLR